MDFVCEEHELAVDTMPNDGLSNDEPETVDVSFVGESTVADIPAFDEPTEDDPVVDDDPEVEKPSFTLLAFVDFDLTLPERNLLAAVLIAQSFA